MSEDKLTFIVISVALFALGFVIALTIISIMQR